MNKCLRTILIILTALIIILPLSARTASDIQPETGRKWDMDWADINQLNMTITNYGIFGHNVETGNAGGYWPSGYPAENYIYGAGIWFGALVEEIEINTNEDGTADTVVTGVDTLVSVGYNPNSGASEMCPGSGENEPGYNDPNEAVYKSTANWPPMDLQGEVIYDSTVSMQDIFVHYSDKDPAQHFTEENLPLGIEVYQTTYAWVGPLKEDIIFMQFEIENDNEEGSALNNCFMAVTTDCDIGNESGSAANDLLGFIDTMTIDGELNQMALGYQFQTESEGGWAHAPGIVAFKYMESPLATEQVDVYHNGEVLIDSGQQLGMTAFRYFTLATDPGTKEERYQVLAGYNHLNFDPNAPEQSFRPFPTADDWGGGVSGYPGVSEAEERAGDKRFCMSSGPFTMPHGTSQKIVVAAMVARDVSELLDKAITAQSVYDAGFKGPVAPEQVSFSIKGKNGRAVLYWDNTVEQIPDPYFEDAGDPSSLLYNPAYREYDVVGYRIYRSRTGSGGTWDQIAQFDLIDDYTVVIWDSIITYNSSGNASIEYIKETLGTNTGVPYVFVDSNLTNGLTYYYQITAYDYNFNAFTVDPSGDTVGAQPLILESAGKKEAVMPRIVPSNYTEAEYTAVMDSTTFRDIDYYSDTIFDIDTTVTPYDTTIVSVTIDSVKLGDIIPHPVNQEAMELLIRPVVDTLISDLEAGEFFIMKFDGIENNPADEQVPSYAYSVYKVSGNDTVKVGRKQMIMEAYTKVLDDGNTADIWKRKASEAVTSDGIAFDVSDYELFHKTWTLSSDVRNMLIEGSYDPSIVKLDEQGRPFFHGSGWYKITWKEETVDDTLSLTCEVMDMQNQMEIEYDSIAKADCWHFNNSTTKGPYTEYINENSGDPLKGMYLSGFKIDFNNTGRVLPMVWDDRPADGDEWHIVLNELPDTTDFDMPPVGAVYNITVDKYQYAANTDSILENVKVVPNPYVVRSEFGSDYNYRKLYFTNLPSKCTISIYTLSGDLVKTLEHDVEFYRKESSSDSTLVKDVTNGQVEWNILTENDQIPAPGLYLYQVQTPDNAKHIGKFAIIK